MRPSQWVYERVKDVESAMTRAETLGEFRYTVRYTVRYTIRCAVGYTARCAVDYIIAKSEWLCFIPPVLP